MRILIEVPTYDGRISPVTFQSLWRLDRRGHDVDLKPCSGYGVAMARNRIAADALAAGYDRAMMVDNDVELPPDALANLLSHDVPICTGYYLNRGVHDGSGITTAFKEGDGYHAFTEAELRDMREHGEHLVRIKACGMGCCLFKPIVFQMLPFPWFEWWDMGKKTVKADDVYAIDASINSLGEDINFCELARAGGFHVHLDTRVACGHEFREVRWPE